MKNIAEYLGSDKKDIELYDNKGNIFIHYHKESVDYWSECTCNEKGNILTYKNSEDYRYEYTYDEDGNPLTYKDNGGRFIDYRVKEEAKEECNKGYSQFMIIEVAKIYDVIDEYLEYDEMWAKGAELLNEFEESEFNVDTKSEHDCMVDFMYAVKRNQKLKR